MAKVQLVSRRASTSPVKVKPKAAPAVKPKEAGLTGLSLKQLLKATPPYIRSNSEDVVVKQMKPATTKGGLPGVRAKTITPSGKQRTVYDTSIIGKSKGMALSSQKHVLVACSCGWFWSHCEYALNHWGSAVIKYSNGEPATVTNPQNQPMLCKHLVKLTQTVLEEKI